MMTDSYMQWYNENEGRNYPVAENVTHKDNSGLLLPTDIVVDVSVIVPPECSDVYFSSIRITPTIVSVALCSSLSGLMVGTYARSQVQPHMAYPLTPVIPDVSGWIVFGTHRSVVTEDYRFSGFAQSGLESKAVHVIPHLPVRRFLRVAGSSSNYADDIVELVAGNGVDISKDPDSNTVIIKLTPDQQALFVGPCKTAVSSSSCGATPIKKIDGVCPDANGRITLRFI